MQFGTLLESVLRRSIVRNGVRGAIVRIKVLLADDSEITRRAIRCLLDAQPELEVVGEAVDFDQGTEVSCSGVSSFFFIQI